MCRDGAPDLDEDALLCAERGEVRDGEVARDVIEDRHAEVLAARRTLITASSACLLVSPFPDMRPSPFRAVRALCPMVAEGAGTCGGSAGRPVAVPGMHVQSVVGL